MTAKESRALLVPRVPRSDRWFAYDRGLKSVFCKPLSLAS